MSATLSGMSGTRRALSSGFGAWVTCGQKPPTCALLRVGAGLAVGLLLAQMSLHGASTTWNGGHSKKETDWNTKQNWSGGAVPAVNDLAVFTTSTYSPSLSANSYIGGLQFNAGANSFTIGGTYTLSISNQNIVVNSANAQTINAPVALVANQTWNAASGDLTVGGTVNLNSYTLTLQEGASRRVALEGIVSGTGALTQSGSGTVSLEAANTYSGATTINGGTLQLGVANGIGSSSAVTVASGATFDLNNYSDTVKSLSGAGNVTLGSGTLTAGNGSDTTYSGVMSGTGGLTKEGSGTLTLSGNNTYSGATTVNAGTLQLGAAGGIASSSAVTVGASGTLDLNNYGPTIGSLSGAGAVTLGSGTLTAGNGSDTTYSGVMSGTGGLTKSGTGTLTLSGANTYSGATTINAGTVKLGAAGGIGSSSAVTVGASGTLDLNNYSPTIASLSGAGAVSLGSGTLTVSSGGSHSGVVSGTGGLSVSGGTLTLSGNNTYSGAVSVSSGATLNVGHANALGSGTAGLALNGTMNLSASPSSSRPLTMNAGSILNANNKSGSFGGLAVAGSSTINLVNDSTSASLNFGAATRTAGTLTINNWDNTLTRDKIFVTSATGSFLANTIFAGSGQTSSALWGTSAPYELLPYGVTPVPEPQAYAAVLGLGALGFVVYRRRLSAKA